MVSTKKDSKLRKTTLEGIRLTAQGLLYIRGGDKGDDDDGGDGVVGNC
jgi:hypothetical protein